ncbi:iron complex outermembrane receptor protein [Neorhizobium huautlense]|uniref:Iron complex outermembrane receptor protein n=1 Tax=Neorhizobium huautlense TaxID=67774 RepID=A0ABT9Q013_9HYPH|nr:TonB-dependent siderophore receptor [Neorhizobium huautlense]MDP9840075.1 iron complex outermembrane receptor protein [Neorhizobium huautlense]
MTFSANSERIRRLGLALLGSSAMLPPMLNLAYAQEGGTQLAPIVVQADGENAKGPVRGIVAKQSATATKSSRAVVETPQSISIATADQIRQQQVTTTSEAMRYTPSTNAEIFGADPRADWIRMRGFIVPELLDGTRMPRATYAWPRIDPYMVERIEALRGPAAALYGQTPPGGLINFVSKKPTDEPLREVQFTLGEPWRKQAAFDFSGPIDDEGQFLYRLTGMVRDAETQVDHVDDNRMFIAPSLTWKPEEGTELTISGHHIRDDGGSLQFLPAPGMLYPSAYGYYGRDTYIGEPGYDDFQRRQSAIGYQFAHTFDNGITFNSSARLMEVDYDLNVVRGHPAAAAVPPMVNRLAAAIHDVARTFTMDNNVSGTVETGPVTHNLLAGVDLLVQNYDYQFGTGTASPLNIYNPVYGQATIGTITNTANAKQNINQVGFYLQDEMSLDNWRLTLTGRYDAAEMDTYNRLNSTRTVNDDGAFTGRAGLLYAFDNGIAPYVSYGTSFEPTQGLSTTGQPWDPNEGKQWEAGVKYQPLGTDHLFTLAAFDLEQSNLVVTSGGVSQQIGRVEMRGIEAEAKINMWEGWDVIASYAYLDSNVTATGKRVIYVPNHQAALWVNHTFSGNLEGFSAGAGVRYTGASFGDTANALEAPAYTLFDVAARLDLSAINDSLKGSEIAVNVANLFDEEYVASCNTVTQCYWGTGRTIRATLTHRW